MSMCVCANHTEGNSDAVVWSQGVVVGVSQLLTDFADRHPECFGSVCQDCQLHVGRDFVLYTALAPAPRTMLAVTSCSINIY